MLRHIFWELHVQETDKHFVDQVQGLLHCVLIVIFDDPESHGYIALPVGVSNYDPLRIQPSVLGTIISIAGFDEVLKFGVQF